MEQRSSLMEIQSGGRMHLRFKAQSTGLCTPSLDASQLWPSLEKEFPSIADCAIYGSYADPYAVSPHQLLAAYGGGQGRALRCNSGFAPPEPIVDANVPNGPIFGLSAKRPLVVILNT